MIRTTFAAVVLLASLSPAASVAQSTTQDELQNRYDRALAGGYKALMLCGAIANAERNGTTRTPESVIAWELTGIQAPLDEIVGELPYKIHRHGSGPSDQISHVTVEWADDMPSRIAFHNSQDGCYNLSIGGSLPPIRTVRENSESERSSALSYVSSAQLADLMHAGFDQQYGSGSRTTAILVMDDGSAAAERYSSGFASATPQRTWSVAKSIAATIVGAAVYRGELDVDRRAGLGNPIYDQSRRAITIDNLLRMASGRYSDTAGNRTDPIYWGGATVDERAATWPLIHQPGTVYRYANNDTLMAIKAIAPTFETHPPAELFARLGMDSTVAETDWQGSYILSSQVWSTARDLARLGELYLNDGVLPDGIRILPEGWVEYVSSPSGPQPDGPFGYGAGFWLFNKSDGIPPDTFAAMGNRGQYVVIVPSRDIVIVRRGEDPTGSRFDIAAFTRDVLAALPDD